MALSVVGSWLDVVEERCAFAFTGVGCNASFGLGMNTEHGKDLL
jgi:hypothetical protein